MSDAKAAKQGAAPGPSGVTDGLKPGPSARLSRADEAPAAAKPALAQDRALADIFRALDSDVSGSLTKAEILAGLARQGILQDDNRVSATLHALSGYSEGIQIDEATFADIVRPNFRLLERVVKGNLVIPSYAPFAAEIGQIFESCREQRSGAVADYIPQLARVDPEQFALAVCTVDGQRSSYGDSDTAFCIQSSCKPINYCMALELMGEEAVHRHVGREPSGRSFNELALNSDNVPHNPLINAGAMICCSMIRPDFPIADRFDYVMQTWAALAGGRRAGYNNAVYLSEKSTADRNFALAYMMREKRAFPERTDLLEVLDFYFQCCSIETTAQAMSIVAATLANAGICPLTEQRIFSSDTVKNCLSLMYSCGMYDFSGEFAFTVGVPAKSGVSGIMMVVIPRVMGFAVWSPRLDRLGNSVRGVEFCKRLVKRFNFHNYDGIAELSDKIDPRSSGASIETDIVFNLINAASKGDMAEISRLIAFGADLDCSDYDGRTPLHLAAAEGREEVVAYLLARGVNPQPKDRWGATPHDDAMRHGFEAVAKTLQTVVPKTR